MSAFYPDVPLAPGVPNVLRASPAAGTDSVPEMTADAPDVAAALPPVWGVYSQSYASVISPDNVISFEIAKEDRIANYPVEQGGFESYSKVEMPYDARLVVNKGGSHQERLQFLSDIDALQKSLDLYIIVTPDWSYRNANVIGYNYRRTSVNGVTLLSVELRIAEVRATATATFTSSKVPASASRVNDGPVQTTAAPVSAGAPE